LYPSKIVSAVWSSATNTSSSSKSWLPVPRMPRLYDVSSRRAWARGTKNVRTTGRPCGSVRGRSPSWTTAVANSHVQCGLPLANGQRPATM
jgi:hypothetical protein